MGLKYRCPKCGRDREVDIANTGVWCQRIMCQPKPGHYRLMKAEPTRRAA